MSGYDLWKLRSPYEDEGPEPEEIAEFYGIEPEEIEARHWMDYEADRAERAALRWID